MLDHLRERLSQIVSTPETPADSPVFPLPPVAPPPDPAVVASELTAQLAPLRQQVADLEGQLAQVEAQLAPEIPAPESAHVQNPPSV